MTMSFMSYLYRFLFFRFLGFFGFFFGLLFLLLFGFFLLVFLLGCSLLFEGIAALLLVWTLILLTFVTLIAVEAAAVGVGVARS